MSEIWNEDYIWRAYACSLRCDTDTTLAADLSIPETRLKAWKKSHPAFANAIREGRLCRKPDVAKGNALTTYLEDKLPSELSDLWDVMKAETDQAAKQTLQLNFATKGLWDQQRLLIHALTATKYDVNRCCSILGISKRTLDNWTNNDAKFAELWRTVEWHKRNFFEQKLIQLVDEGDSKAIIAVNQSINADRGYGNKVQVSGQINHVHGLIDLTNVPMSPDLQGQLLAAIRDSGYIDVDGLVVEQAGSGN